MLPLPWPPHPLILSILCARLAILRPLFLECVTCPHLQVQLRGLEAAILQTRQVIHTALHYTLELLTTFNLIHAVYDLILTNWKPNYEDTPPFRTTAFPHLFPITAPTTPASSTPGYDPLSVVIMASRPPLASQSTTTTSTTGPGPLAVTSRRLTFTTATVPRPALSRTFNRSRSRSRLNPRQILVSPLIGLDLKRPPIHPHHLDPPSCDTPPSFSVDLRL